MSQQVKFEMTYNIEGKDTVCGFIKVEDHKDNEPYYLLCATIGGYTREYELKVEPGDKDCQYHFASDVPEELKRHECEISDEIKKIESQHK